MPTLLEIRNLTVQFPAAGAWMSAVRNLSLSIGEGETLGLVGESGSGKSVTSLAIMRLLVPHAQTSGEIWFTNGHGRANLLAAPEADVRRLRGSRMTMIFQEPMTALNPVMRVGDQIAEAIAAHPNGSVWRGDSSPRNADRSVRATHREAWDRAVEAMNDVAIPDALRRARDYPHQLSGGMRQRIMIAMAIVNRPQLLIADEPTTALDVTIQAQILELLAQLRVKFRLAMLFISHDLAVISQIADRVAVMYAGNLVEIGSRQDVFHAPAHPYTCGLLRAAPSLRTDRTRRLETIEGTVPPIQALPPGCPFEPRCESRMDECTRAVPPLVEVGPSHWARCPVVSR